MTAPFVHLHRVRFDEVDAAGIVYFARFFTWCHDAMEAMLAGVEGGYVALVNVRRLGFPAVHVEADYAAPLRFGEEVHVGATVERLGKSSITIRFDLRRASDGDHVATLRHVVALTDLVAMRARPIPDDVRAALEAWLAPA
ncbi:MAG: acyl-CoA thioesterase [Polyangiaceae bacterium]